MSTYQSPKVTDLGSLSEQTLTTITKTGPGTDTIIQNGVPQQGQGSMVVVTP